jgi:ATP-dependent helicase/nuclease subunit A
VHQRNGEADRAEQIRLLYVAATRARDHLVVSLHRRDREKCAATWLAGPDSAAALAQTVIPEAGPDERGGGDHDAAPAEGAPDDVLAARARWRDERAERLMTASRPPTIAATALAAGEPDDPNLAKDAPETDRPAWRRGRAGTSIGRAVHATLQTIDLATGDGLEATARAQALAEEIPGREAEVQALVRSVLDAPVVQAAVAGARFWREVPVAATVDGVTIEGFVDLLVETPEGLVVVDYKTDRAPNDDELDALMAKYRIQGAAYALALERVLGRAVAGCVFVFARRGAPAIERAVADVAAAVAEVETRVRALAP